MFARANSFAPTGACGAAAATPGAARILDATKNNYPEDTGRWTVTGVF